MGFWSFLRGKKEPDSASKQDVKSSFESVKHDVKKIGHWIKHLDEIDKRQENDLEKIFERLDEIDQNINEIKSFVSFFDTRISKQVFKQRQTAVGKQTRVEGVQTAIQTAVQTAFLKHLSVMERAIVWVLANADPEMRLSCQDIAVILGKEKSTVRGQINNIKQKSEDLINETLDKEGKKRYWISDDVREMIFTAARKSMKDSKKAKNE